MVLRLLSGLQVLWLSCLQVLCLLLVLLFQLLRLLLMPLFDLLIFRGVSVALCQALVVLLLFLLQFLVVLILPCIELGLLLLIFLVHFSVARIWSRRTWMWLKFFSVGWRRSRNVIFRTRCRCFGPRCFSLTARRSWNIALWAVRCYCFRLFAASIRLSFIGCPRFFGTHDLAIVKCSRLRRRCNGGPALVRRGS